MSCLPPVKGIPYDFNGSLSLENQYIILAQKVCELETIINDNMQSWFTKWAEENIDNIIGNIIYNENDESISFTITRNFNKEV